MAGAGAAAIGSVAPLGRSFAESRIKKYRLTAKAATINLTGERHPDRCLGL
jgi:hypothetical protein